MKKSKVLLTKLSQKLDIPSYVAAGLPYTTMQGFGEISIDLQKGLLSYSQTEISVLVSLGTICVSGENLAIHLMRENRITIRGEIYGVSFLRENCK